LQEEAKRRVTWRGVALGGGARGRDGAQSARGWLKGVLFDEE